MIHIGINGFGRIGRNFLRTVLQDPEALQKIKVVAINIGPAKPSMIAHMFKYDTILGTYPGTVEYDGTYLHIDTHSLSIISALDPAQCHWNDFTVDWVVEASGKFTKREGASKHLQAGAKAVLITAPAHDEDITIIPGVNDASFERNKHTIVSLGSCTTNAFVPMLKVLHDTFGLEQCCMTTVHSYTNSQVLLDVEAKDERRSRAAALNIIPTTTGAFEVAVKVIPELKGRVQAMALRVPVAKVSLIDLTLVSHKPIASAAINKAFNTVAQGAMRNIVGFTMEPLVSSDFSGDPHSVTIDGQLTTTCGTHMGKVFGWYDNEWGYSCRLKDFLVKVATA